MKVIIFSTNPNSLHLLNEEVAKTNHVVMDTVDQRDLLIQAISQTTPHLLVAHFLELSDTDRQFIRQVSQMFPDLVTCLLSGNLAKYRVDWMEELQEGLDASIRPHTPRPYADGTRYVLHDLSLQKYWKGKLNRAERTEGWQQVCSRQEARFVLMLQTGRKNHESAKQYFDCLIAQQAGLDQELAYRLVHGSYKSLCWCRELAAKWLGLLAHYVQDVEPEYLPAPFTPGPAVDFVYHTMPSEGMYAAILLMYFGVKPSVTQTIADLLEAKFDGQNDGELLNLSLKLYGLAKLLEQVGRSQVNLMDAWLSPEIIHRLNSDDAPRGEHRDAGILRDFFDMNFIILSPEPLSAILRGFHAGTTYVEAPKFVPSFAEFRRAHHRP